MTKTCVSCTLQSLTSKSVFEVKAAMFRPEMLAIGWSSAANSASENDVEFGEEEEGNRRLTVNTDCMFDQSMSEAGSDSLCINQSLSEA